MDLAAEYCKQGKEHLNEKHDIKRAKKEANSNVDFISNLPETVLHQILSLLHPKDAGRTCILSKRWEQSWKSYQILDFDLRRYHQTKKKTLTNYKNMMNQLLKCRQDQLLNIFKFRLRFIVTKRLLPDVEGWISTVIEMNVRQLEIHAKGIKSVQFCLPMSVMCGSSITALTLYGCILPTFDGVKVNLPHLQKLSLKKMDIPGSFLVAVFDSCPMIDELRLIGCTGFKILTIGSCNKLKRVDIHKCHPLKKIAIKSPELESFWYFYEKKKLCSINLLECRMIKDLVLEYPRMNDEFFQDLISGFPLLEKLVLSRCYGLKKIKVSGDKIKKLVIRRCRKLVEAEVNAPNLVSLEYHGQRMPFSFSALLCLKEVLFRFEPVSKAQIDWKEEEAARLQSFFSDGHLKGLKVMIWNKQKVDIFEDKLVLVDPLSKIKKSHSVKLSACYRDLLTEALQAWPFAPKMSVYSFCNSEFPEDIYKELNQGKEEPNCCAYFKNKCWRHYLKSIKLEKWFSDSCGQPLAPASPEWQNTEFELDWNTDKRGWKKEIPRVKDGKSQVE